MIGTTDHDRSWKLTRNITMAQTTPESRKTAEPGLKGIKNIIAIASGKGGVGKSTVAVNLAMALKTQGKSVGLLDADIYGPSQPGMLGSKHDQPEIGDNVLYPVNRHGISFVSMGLLTDRDSPVVWRAPIAMKMIHQFLGAVMWGTLDYLLVDLPPGTGDVQLTLAQQAQLTGAVIVTTPQEISLGVARKGLKMFEQVKVPILGVIENMSGFICKHCGNETEIFDKGGGERMAMEFDVPFLGSLPLDPEIMMSGEQGVPILSKTKDSHAAKSILALADKLKESLSRETGAATPDKPKKYEVGGDGNLHIVWADGKEAVYEPYDLRIHCPCAECVDEDTGRRLLDPGNVPLDIKIKDVSPIGNYGISVHFSDGHSTGIYKFSELRSLFERTQSEQSNSQSFEV
jgi:ATP-binding protein involved in chromosome partitioning